MPRNRLEEPFTGREFATIQGARFLQIIWMVDYLHLIVQHSADCGISLQDLPQEAAHTEPHPGVSQVTRANTVSSPPRVSRG